LKYRNSIIVPRVGVVARRQCAPAGRAGFSGMRQLESV